MKLLLLSALFTVGSARRGGHGAGPYLQNPCLNSTFKSAKFCDATVGIDERAADIVQRLSIVEKIDALGTNTGPLPSVGLPAYNWWSEATHGISHVRDGPGSSTPYETNFALPITTAGSFNRSVWKATGHAIGVEARAFMNAGNAYSTYWAPVINLVRDPRWGRNIETPGEDPYLSGQYAINFVKGFQEHPEAPGEVMASACCKHYVANSMDGSTVDGHTATRVDFNAVISEQDLVDSYLAPFQDCVEQGEVTSLMCSYNSVNGKPSCANPWLLETVARDQWQFDGYITSDCDADANVFSTHHYTATPEEAVADVLHAGTDVDCGGFVQTHGASALAKGLITKDDIDTRLKYLFRMRIRLGHFDPPGPLQQIPKTAVCTEETIALARDGTVQGSVMLKNADKTLPLTPKSKVAVIGPNANLSQAIGTYYGGSNPCPGQAGASQWYTAVDAIAEHADVTSMLGVPSVTSSDLSQIPAAVAAAKAAEEVVMVVGQDGSIEHEGHDRTSIELSDGQQALVKAVSAAAKKPIVVLILTGGAVDVADMLANDKVGAIIHCGQPSVTVSGAGDLVFGKAVPAGRMIQTIYPSSFADEVSIFDFGMRPGPGLWPAPNCSSDPESSAGCPNATNPGRTHRFYTQKPTLPFGFGLSFSTFSYKVVGGPPAVSLDAVREMLAANAERAIPKAAHAAVPLAQYVVEVTNTGSIDADDVVLGLLKPPGAGVGGTPLQTLFGFERVHVKAGATVTVHLGATLLDFAHVNADGKHRATAGEYTVQFGIPETAEHGMGFATTSTVAA